MNGSLTTMEVKEGQPSTLAVGVQMRHWLVPHPHVVDNDQEGFLRSWGPAAHLVPQPGVSAPGR